MTKIERLFAVVGGACAAMLVACAPAQAQGPAAPNAPPFADYKPGDVRVYMSPALRAAMDKAKPQAEAAVGRKLVIEMSQARLLQAGIESGQPFEVALLTMDALDDVVAKGKVIASSKVRLADVPLGLAVRGAVSKVDIKSPEGVKAAMLGAKGVRRNYGVGASVPLFEHVVDTLGVEAQVKDRYIAMVGAPKPIPEQPLAAGEYELMFNMASEIKDRPGWTYLGAVPGKLRLPTLFGAGIGPLGDKASAEALMTFIKGPVFTKALVDSGMEPIS